MPRPGLRLASVLALILAVGLVFYAYNYLEKQTVFERRVVCLDRETGRVIWDAAGFSSKGLRRYHANSYATPTPVTDGRYVIANYGPGMVCVDFDGNVVWTRMEPDYSQGIRYGAGASPILFEDMVIHTFMAESPEDTGRSEDGQWVYEKDSYIAALDITTGEEIWKVTPPSAHDTYATPLLRFEGDRPVIYVCAWQWTYALDPRNGEQIWMAHTPIDQLVPSAVTDNGVVYVAGGTHGKKGAVAIRTGGSGDVTDTHVLWEASKRTPECSSPIMYDGLLYWTKQNGVVVCIDPATGEEVWAKRLKGGGEYLGSPVAGDGKIYFIATTGDVTAIEAGRQFKVLARNAIGEPSNSTPVFAGRNLLIRGKDHLFCVQPAEHQDDPAR